METEKRRGNSEKNMNMQDTYVQNKNNQNPRETKNNLKVNS